MNEIMSSICHRHALLLVHPAFFLGRNEDQTQESGRSQEIGNLTKLL